MATLTVTGVDTDYRDGSPAIPASTDTIVFSTSGTTTARFNSSQFGGSPISDTVAITGDGNFNTIAVHTLSDPFFSAAGWTFSNWSVGDGVNFFGTNDAETIVGSIQSNSFLGGGGADSLTGGNQGDLFVYQFASHVEALETINGLGGIDRIQVDGTGVDLSLAIIVNVEEMSVAISAILDGDQIGSGAINTVVGVGSNATLIVNGNSVDLDGVTFTNWVGNFVVVNGTGGADSLTGSSQNDTITGGLGADTLIGGDGDDTFVYNTFAELASGESIGGGGGSGDTLRVNVGQGFTLDVSGAGVLTGVEKVVFTQAGTLKVAGDNVGTASGLINAVTGSAGANRIDCPDSFVDLSGLTFTNWTAGEDIIFLAGTGGNDTVTGSSQNDQFSYNTGGVDTLSGGGGADLFSVNQNAFLAGASINGGSGTDEISTSGSDFSTGSVIGVERLTFFDIFIGTSVSITVGGTQVRAGAIAVVNGGDKDDTLTVKGASVNLTGVTFNDWTSGVDRIVINGGASAAGALTGSSLADEINGGSGNDLLNGGAGLDALNGGLGDDTYVLGAETGDTITDTGGVDTITTTISRSISGFGSIDNLTLLGTAATGTGNGLANTILGNALANILNGAGGADTLNGGVAADTMRGGADGDTYIVDNVNDVVDESVAGSSGTDLVLASVNYSLAAKALGSIENITLTGGAAEAAGNDLANVISGNAAANTLDGGGGADQLLGASGNDRLIGGLGPDQIAGGAGIDTFAFLALADSGKKTSARDTILDFTAEDFIDLSAIDAKKGGKDNKFKFIGKDAFDGNKGELRFQKKQGDAIVTGDVNGDGKADLSILLDNVKKLAKSDFEL